MSQSDLRKAKVFVHPSAIVESEDIGDGTNIWAFAHVMRESSIGSNCNLGDHSFVESGAHVGNNVTIKNYVCIWQGVTVGDDCFLGPRVTFTNDLWPRSPRMPQAQDRYAQTDNWLAETVVGRGCSIGAGSTIVAGVTLGDYCMVAAGSVVTRNVNPHELVMGVPARPSGFVCRCGQKIDSLDADCHVCMQPQVTTPR